MSIELRVTFPGEHPDARKAVEGLDRLLSLISGAEPRQRRAGATTWQLSHLALGSVAVGISVLAPREGATETEAAAAFPTVVDGFIEAQDREGIPEHWTKEMATQARELLRLQDDGLSLELRQDGRVTRTALITRLARLHLDVGLERSTQDSIGSVIGQLDSVSVHDKYVARLWPERGGNSVPVQFDPGDTETVKEHLGARVEASGWVRRDHAGQLVSVRLRSLERLPTFEESPPLTDLIGLDPDFTGGMSASDYLRELRGEAR